jgi:hypothetical protein
VKPRVNVLLRSEQTNGVLAVMDNGMSAGAQGPPLHLVAAREDGVEPPPEALGPVPEVIVVGPQIAAR